MKNQKKAFTLVELIVVITILAILWTIAFLSLQWYSRDARNSKRTAELEMIEKSLALFYTNKWFYPDSNNPTNITYSWTTAWSQWTFLSKPKLTNRINKQTTNGSINFNRICLLNNKSKKWIPTMSSLWMTNYTK